MVASAIVDSRLRALKWTPRVALTVIVATASTAAAQGGEDAQARAGARTAATQGLKALQEGRYQDAVDLCTRAESLMHAPTHLLLIARAQTKLGHLVEAQEAYIKIERDRLDPKAPRAFVDAQAAAADERAALAPRVPTMKVTLEGADPKDVELTLDGNAFPAALVGMASPINPGAHTLAAKSPSATADPVTVSIAEGARESVTITMKPNAAPEAEAEASAPAAGESPPEEPGSGNAGLKAGGWIGLGIGVAGLAAGTFFVIKNHNDRNDANGLCGPKGCPDSQRTEIAGFDHDANTAGTMAWVSYGVGAAGIVTGAALLWLGHGKPMKPQSGQVIPWFGARAMGVRVTF
jgi:hypothetical protein